MISNDENKETYQVKEHFTISYPESALFESANYSCCWPQGSRSLNTRWGEALRDERGGEALRDEPITAEDENNSLFANCLNDQ